MKQKTYTTYEEDTSMACEPAVALATNTHAITTDMDYAHIDNGTLVITSDIEQEILEAEGEKLMSMDEFKRTFAKWLA